MQLTMALACVLGFYLFRLMPRPSEHSGHTLLLDIALLVICMIGVVAFDIISLVAVIDGDDNKIDGWGITLFLPLLDVFQCAVQVIRMKKPLETQCLLYF